MCGIKVYAHSDDTDNQTSSSFHIPIYFADASHEPSENREQINAEIHQSQR